MESKSCYAQLHNCLMNSDSREFIDFFLLLLLSVVYESEKMKQKNRILQIDLI